MSRLDLSKRPSLTDRKLVDFSEPPSLRDEDENEREGQDTWGRLLSAAPKKLRLRHWAVLLVAATGIAYSDETREKALAAILGSDAPEEAANSADTGVAVEPIVEPASEESLAGDPTFDSPSTPPVFENPHTLQTNVPTDVEYLDLEPGESGDGKTDLFDDPGFEPYSTKRFARELDERITINLDVGYFYDSNISLSRDDDGRDSGGVFTADLSVILNSDHGGGRDGLFYRLGYTTSAFSYSTSESRRGRDPFEHQFNGALGYAGAHTVVTLGGDLGLRNGNGLEYTQIERETGRSDGTDWGVNLSVHRDLNHGSLEAKAAYRENDYSGSSIFGDFGDQESILWDLAWYYQPGWAPKSQIGLGVRGGIDEVDTHGGEQQHLAPSLRFRHQVTEKSRIEGAIGTDLREFEGAGTIPSQETLTYEIAAHWQATARTGFELSFNRGVNPSVTSTNESYESTSIELGMNTSLPAGWFLNIHGRYEHADYFSVLAGGEAPREDDYFAAGIALSHAVKLTDSLSGSLTFFYDYRQNDSALSSLDYDQHITGLKFGISF